MANDSGRPASIASTLKCHLADQIFEDPILALEDLARAVRRFTEANGARISPDGAKRRAVREAPTRLDCGGWNLVRADPIDDCRRRWARRPDGVRTRSTNPLPPARLSARPRSRIRTASADTDPREPWRSNGRRPRFRREDIAVVTQAARQPNLGAGARTCAAIADAAGQTTSTTGELEPQPGAAGLDVGHPGGRVIRRGRRDAVATRSDARETKAPVGCTFDLDERGSGRVEKTHRHQRYSRALHSTGPRNRPRSPRSRLRRARGRTQSLRPDTQRPAGRESHDAESTWAFVSITARRSCRSPASSTAVACNDDGLVNEEVRTCRSTGPEHAKSGSPSGSSCSRQKRSSRKRATSSRSGGRSCRGSRSTSSIRSRPPWGRRRSRTSSGNARSFSSITSCSGPTTPPAARPAPRSRTASTGSPCTSPTMT